MGGALTKSGVTNTWEFLESLGGFMISGTSTGKYIITIQNKFCVAQLSLHLVLFFLYQALATIGGLEGVYNIFALKLINKMTLHHW